MSDYRIRAATLDDVDVLVHHRIAMFKDMGVAIDTAAVTGAFRDWLTTLLPSGEYRAWVAEAPGGDVVAGGGMTIIPWPPGPWLMGGRIAFIYNVYSEPEHRRRGLARMIMGALHKACRAEGIGVAALNASGQAETLYESLGYRKAPAPMMIGSLEGPGV